MCGIFGFAVSAETSLTAKELKAITNKLFKFSESRGKEAAGITLMRGNIIDVYKEPVSASKFIKTKTYSNIFKNLTERIDRCSGTVVMGHSRLVTNGSQLSDNNNQPVVKSEAVCVHNGIIVNDNDLWSQNPVFERNSTVDTEILPALIQNYRNTGLDIIASISNTFLDIKGATSTGILFNDLDCLVLATNNGSLYIAKNETNTFIVFASEQFILKKFLDDFSLSNKFGPLHINQVPPSSGNIFRLNITENTSFTFDEDRKEKEVTKGSVSHKSIRIFKSSYKPNAYKYAINNKCQSYRSLLTIDYKSIDKIKRCTNCLLPETFPFIQFDEQGQCNICRQHKSLKYRGIDALDKVVVNYKGHNTKPDCIVSLSGGRDSCYSLHYVKNILNMNPIAYSYDWGMLTDLGRRNQSRITGALGVEHIIVSADITKKRKYIRKNVEAWLKKPALGTIPLFMAGDKQYFYYANKVKKQNDVDLVVMGENHLEKTGFKNGFAGVQQKYSGSMAYHVSSLSKIAMLFYYVTEYLKNPKYINTSILDTMGAFISYFIIPHDYLNLFDYIEWEEEKINATLMDCYDWELSDDTPTTWRIGDGTVAFYNYIYYTVAGFTENDTFRSNQIREGILNRDTAKSLIIKENEPRLDSIKWYCDTIGLDMKNTLRTINNMPKLYETTKL